MSQERKKERKKEKERKNAIYSGHLRLCQQPRAAHALRSDQFSYMYAGSKGRPRWQALGHFTARPYAIHA
jgi:hypothetical protein